MGNSLVQNILKTTRSNRKKGSFRDEGDGVGTKARDLTRVKLHTRDLKLKKKLQKNVVLEDLYGLGETLLNL